MDSEAPVEKEIESLAKQENLPALVDAREISPNAFEEVMARERELLPVQEPFFKNRAFIAAICVIAGVTIGKLTTDTKVVEKPIQPPQKIVLSKVESDPKNLIFRNLRSVAEFDPWNPMNGGFPLPPQETQARLIESYTAPPPSGERVVTTMPKPISGGFNQSGDIVPIDPGVSLPPIGGDRFPRLPNSGSQTTNPQVSSQDTGVPLSSEKYVSMIGSSTDPEQSATKVITFANSSGGTGRLFAHMTEEGSVESYGALLLIPASKFEAIKSQILGLGDVKIDGTIPGDPKDHQATIQGVFNARLTRLRDKRKELLVDFLEDAQPVKLINDAIDQESRALQATRLSGKTRGKVAIRIMFK
jgi:hypothetical protein